MALIVEDGTIVAGAESYVTVAAATTYHSARGNSAWALLTNAQMEESLRRATDYMLQMFRQSWKGYRKSVSQALDWPRSFVYLEPYVVGAVGPYPYLLADNVVPAEVKNACSELALKASAGALSPDLARAKLSVTVGEIAVTYDPNSPESKRYRSIDAMLRPYIDGSSMNIKLIRS